ncbi:MAG: hypothetical protein AB1405_05000 [Bdellovibrionota bacterium]
MALTWEPFGWIVGVMIVFGGGVLGLVIAMHNGVRKDLHEGFEGVGQDMKRIHGRIDEVIRDVAGLKSEVSYLRGRNDAQKEEL